MLELLAGAELDGRELLLEVRELVVAMELELDGLELLVATEELLEVRVLDVDEEASPAHKLPFTLGALALPFA